MSEVFTVSTSKFDVQVEGLDLKNCSSVSGLGAHTEKLIFERGTNQDAGWRKGRTFASDITVQRVFADKKVFQWFHECKQGQLKKRSGSVICKDDEGKEVARFNFTGAWPIAWAAPSFSTHSHSTLATETVVLSVESIELV